MLIFRKPLLLLLGLSLAYGLVWAQGALRDPTTPPPGIKTSGAAAVAQGEEGAVGVAAPQSIIRITPVGGGKQAVIDGRALQTGEQVKQWRLVSITANGVVLKDSRGTRTVPAATSPVRKTPVTGTASKQ